MQLVGLGSLTLKCSRLYRLLPWVVVQNTSLARTKPPCPLQSTNRLTQTCRGCRRGGRENYTQVYIRIQGISMAPDGRLEASHPVAVRVAITKPTPPYVETMLSILHDNTTTYIFLLQAPKQHSPGYRRLPISSYLSASPAPPPCQPTHCAPDPTAAASPCQQPRRIPHSAPRRWPSVAA